MKKTVLFSIFMILFACGNPQKSGPLDKVEVTAEVKQMLYDYHEAIEQRGLRAEFQYLDDSSDFFWVPPGYTSALSYDSVKTILMQNDKALKKAEFEWSALEIFPLSNSIATYSGIVHAQTTDTAEVVSVIRIIESGTLVKRNDGWKLLSGQSAVLGGDSDN